MKNEQLSLSESERCLIAAWIKAERRWPTARWISLVGSGTLSVCYAFGTWWFHSFVFNGGGDAAAMRVAILASASPLLWGGLVMSLGWFGLTVSRWKTGNLERRILLKLLAAHESIEEVDNYNNTTNSAECSSIGELVRGYSSALHITVIGKLPSPKNAAT